MRSKKSRCRDNDSYWLTGVKGGSKYLKFMVIPSVGGRHGLTV